MVQIVTRNPQYRAISLTLEGPGLKVGLGLPKAEAKPSGVDKLGVDDITRVLYWRSVELVDRLRLC